MSEISDRCYAVYERYEKGEIETGDDLIEAVVEGIEDLVAESIHEILLGERQKIERLGPPVEGLGVHSNGHGGLCPVRTSPLVAAAHDYVAGAMTLADVFGVGYEKEGF